MVIDEVAYDGGPAFPDPNGASMALLDPVLDNNDYTVEILAAASAGVVYPRAE